jgi:CysZ protein
MAQPLVPQAPAPLALSPPRPGFRAGALAIFSGFGFIATTPAVWPLALVPVAIGTGLFAILSVVAIERIPPLFAAWLGGTSGLLATIVGWVATGIAMVFAGLIGFGLAQPLSGPALERIVRRVEAKDGAPTWPPTSFTSDMVRSLESVLVSSALGVPLLALLFIIGFVIPPAVVITVPLKFVVVALLAAWDLCDYPLSIRGVPIRSRVAFMARNIWAMIGFGLGLALLALLPCMLLLALPAGVAGAARLIVALERAEATGPGPRLRE